MPSESNADDVFFSRPGLADVRWDPTVKAVRTEWLGWANPTEFKAVLEAGLRAMEQHRSPRGMVDAHAQKVVQKSDQDWVNASWFPRALATGLTHLAIVTPISEVTRMNIEGVLSGASATRLVVAYFATLEEATGWLSRVPMKAA